MHLFLYRETPVGIQTDFSAETMEFERKWNDNVKSCEKRRLVFLF